jgi:hypothetical protein
LSLPPPSPPTIVVVVVAAAWPAPSLLPPPGLLLLPIFLPCCHASSSPSMPSSPSQRRSLSAYSYCQCCPRSRRHLPFGLLAHVREFSMTCFSTCTSGVGATITLLVFIFDLILFFLPQRIRRLLLLAEVFLFLAACFYGLGRCCIRRRPRDMTPANGGGRVPANSTGPTFEPDLAARYRQEQYASNVGYIPVGESLPFPKKISRLHELPVPHLHRPKHCKCLINPSTIPSSFPLLQTFVTWDSLLPRQPGFPNSST